VLTEKRPATPATFSSPLRSMVCISRAWAPQVIIASVSASPTVSFPGDYAPLAFRNAAGELQGYDVDMARDLGRTLGLKVAKSFARAGVCVTPPIAISNLSACRSAASAGQLV
jgi:cyclohexadienyl dehydratase